MYTYGKWKCIWQNVCIEVLPILNVYSIMYSEKLVLVVFMYSADWWYRRSKGSLLVLHTYIYVKRNAMWTGSECARSEVNTFTKYWQMGQLLRITTSYSKKLSAYLLWVKIWNNVCIPNPKEKMSVYNSSEVEQNHSLSIEF